MTRQSSTIGITTKTIVHTDTCEPFPVSRDRYLYFVTFTNDLTAFSLWKTGQI
jgi:hypothetical protein